MERPALRVVPFEMIEQTPLGSPRGFVVGDTQDMSQEERAAFEAGYQAALRAVGATPAAGLPPLVDTKAAIRPPPVDGTEGRVLASNFKDKALAFVMINPKDTGTIPGGR